MTTSSTPQPACISIETDLFTFEAPQGYQVQELDEQAELVGENDELLVVSSYSIDQDSSDEDIEGFVKNVSSAMADAANEPDLLITSKLKKETAPSGLPIWRVKAEATDKSHFFDQYAAIHDTIAVVVTVEGNYEDKASSALIEEAIYCLEFKSLKKVID